MNSFDQMDYDYYRGFDHGVHFVITEMHRLAKQGNITVEGLIRSIDPQWDIAKQKQREHVKKRKS